jgi:hybrid cluster-associated redox disulfide protein
MPKKQTTKKGAITTKMRIGDVVNKYPESAEIMMRSGMHCIGCLMATQETIEQGAIAHGMSKEQISKMLKEMNAVAKR